MTDQAVAAGGGTYNWWREERAERQASYDAYFAEHDAEFKAFKNTALGNTGIPMVMLRLFSEIFPDIWGGPADSFAPDPRQRGDRPA